MNKRGNNGANQQQYKLGLPCVSKQAITQFQIPQGNQIKVKSWAINGQQAITGAMYDGWQMATQSRITIEHSATSASTSASELSSRLPFDSVFYFDLLLWPFASTSH